MDDIKFKRIMKNQPDDVSDYNYILSRMTDDVFYISNPHGEAEYVSIGNMHVSKEYFLLAMSKCKKYKNLFSKMMELVFIYDEVNDQLNDIIKQYMHDEIQNETQGN